MKRIILLLPFLLILTGCPGNVKTEVVEVKIPVSSCPAPKEVLRPTLPIDSLSTTDAADPGKVAQAYKATVRALIGYAQELEQILEGYKKAPTPTK